MVKIIMINIISITIIGIMTTKSFAKHKYSEKYYQEKWCKKQNGQVEYILPDRTRCDCLTENNAIEFDFAPKFYEAIGQSLHYSMLAGRLSGIVLIMESPNDQKYIDRAQRIIDHWKFPVAVWIIRSPQF